MKKFIELDLPTLGLQKVYLTMATLMEQEVVAGKSISEIWEDFQNLDSPMTHYKICSDIVYCGMVIAYDREDKKKDFTIYDVRDDVSALIMSDAETYNKILTAYWAVMPKADPAEEKKTVIKES